MENQKFDINKLRVASPCSVGWETMSGDERSRHCNLCQLNVYNIAGMTSGEVRNLIETGEGRVCIRLYKRADGSVLTKDCPVSFRAYQKRVARFAGAALATILGLFSVSFGQKENGKNNDSKSEISTTKNQTQQKSLRGVIRDLSGAIVPNAEIKLTKRGSNYSKKIKSDSEGSYHFYSLSAGTYDLNIKSSGFKNHRVVAIEIKDEKEYEINVELVFAGDRMTIGIYVDEPVIDTTSSGAKTTITLQQIEKLPH